MGEYIGITGGSPLVSFWISPLIGGCRFLRPRNLLAPSCLVAVRVRDLSDIFIFHPTRSALANAAVPGQASGSPVWPRPLSCAGRPHRSPELLPVRPVAYWNVHALRPCLSSCFLKRWVSTVDFPVRVNWSSLRRGAISGHNGDVTLRLVLHALPHPDHQASAGSSCPACGSVDGSLGHRYWGCQNNRLLDLEAFTIIGRPPDLQAWIFGSSLEDDELDILASEKSRIYRCSLPNKYPKKRENEQIFGGALILLAVIPRSTLADELNARLKSSVLWQYVEKISLKTNMRVQLQQDEYSERFAKQLLDIRNVKMEIEETTPCITLPEKILSHFFQIHRIIRKIFNELILLSITTITCELVNYPIKLLNSLDLPGMPRYILSLKIGSPIIVLTKYESTATMQWDLAISKKIMNIIIEATILNRKHRGVLLPRIPMIPTDTSFEFKRRRFPVQLAFVIQSTGTIIASMWI
ncbi:hypothetical protein LAZ67_X000339 [Cordylochernes scorpioides]|uniref:ATP-dependent DNA helicase n=1 Tax=Cordylochernes scorpioides TaxID=51811 RepID=A0ABY6LRI2_9ARAC|nr:hypothetical protein LAZ67_X000339 [Cordylochernes scorpioides]